MIDRHKRESARSPPRPARRDSPNKSQHVVPRVASKKRETSKDPTVILSAPIIGGKSTRVLPHTKTRMGTYGMSFRHPHNNLSTSSSVMYSEPLKGHAQSNGNVNARTVILDNVSRSRQSMPNRKQATAGVGHVRHRTRSKKDAHRHRSRANRSTVRRKSHLSRRRTISKVKSSPVRVRKWVQRQKQHNKAKKANKSNNSIQNGQDKSKAVDMLNSMLKGVHFDSQKNLFYPGNDADIDKRAKQEPKHSYLKVDSTPVEVQTTDGGKEEKPLRRKQSNSSCDKQYLQTLKTQLDELDSKKKLNRNEKYIKGQYKKLLLSNALSRGAYPVHPSKLTPLIDKASLRNLNNNAGSSDDETDESLQVPGNVDLPSMDIRDTMPVSVNDVGNYCYRKDTEAAKESRTNSDVRPLQSSFPTVVFNNDNNNASTLATPDTVANTNVSSPCDCFL